MKTITDENKIHEFLHRGVELILPDKEFTKTRLLSGEILTVYLGIDPTGPNLHIGHAIALKKLSQLQKLGHKIILLMGDFTARIGDPTDKLATRKTLKPEEIAENLKNYKNQASKIISFEGENPVEIKFNNDWLGKMNFADVLGLCSQVTVQQLLERDMFQKRITEEKPIYVHELLYPLMQGYDSVAMTVDGEIGGNDQLFNMLMGRSLLKSHNKEKFIMTVKLLTDATGTKMGKSEGNMVTLNDSPDVMYGKIMSWTDGMIVGGFELCTDISQEEILDMEIGMQNGENPMQYKKRLAREIVTMYHSHIDAEQAQANWEQTFSEGGIPDQVPEIIGNPEQSLIDIFSEQKIVASKSEFRRLFDEGALKILTSSEDAQDATSKIIEEKLHDVNQKITTTSIIKIGKKKFIKVVI